jgi:hypothetical protein
MQKEKEIDYSLDKVRGEGLWFPANMAWATPTYTRSQVDAAGAALTRLMGDGTKDFSGDEIVRIFDVLNNWRASHNFPLNTFQIGLRRNARRVDSNSLVAQRIKRLSSIMQKLRRFPSIRLSQIQDIGGCRAIVGSVADVDRIVKLYKESDIKHKLDHIDDYTFKPKPSGYRGVHLIYRYYSDRKETYNGLKIEIQLRSQLQHAWATAVETVGTFIRQALKSSQGQEEWLRFFALMGTAFAHREHTPLVPQTPTSKRELKEELRRYTQQLDVEGHLHTYGTALQTLEEHSAPDAHYFLLKLDAAAKSVSVTGYRSNELAKANEDYLAVERAIIEEPGVDAVLVSVESVSALRRAYPNYFLDTHAFIEAVRQTIK